MDFNDEKLVNDIDIMVLISNISYLSSSEKSRVLSLSWVREKIKRDLLGRCLEGDVYGNFRRVISSLGVDTLISILDYRTIHDTFRVLTRSDFPSYSDDYKMGNYDKIDEIESEIEKSKYRNTNEYKLFVCLMEESPDEVLEWILNDDDLFKEYINISDNMYSMVSMFSYDLIVKLIYKLEELGFGTGNISFNFSSVNSEDKIRLLGEKFSDETIIKLIDYFDAKAKSYFFLNDKRANYLYKKATGFTNLIRSGVRFSRDILLQNDFFDMLKHSNFSEFRININAVEKYNDPLIIQSRLAKYYDELINEYDKNRGIFKYYGEILDNPSLLKSKKRDDFIFNFDVKYAFSPYMDYDNDGNIFFENSDELLDKLKSITSLKLSEVIVDALFCDSIYNVWLNIREMLRYNEKMIPSDRIIDKGRVSFYELIFNFDNVSSDDKIELFNKLKDKNVNSMFYDDLRKLKDYAYDRIRDDMFVISNNGDKISDELSKKYGTPVYDLRDSKYTMMVRALGCRYQESTNNSRDCYSIVSDENNEVYQHGNYDNIYGYSSFDNDRVIHMLEMDSFSNDISDRSGVSIYVNRIMTSKEITNGSSWYSEVDISNMKDDNGKYETMKPDFVVAYDTISDINVIESIRLGIPIVLIKKSLLKDSDRIDTGFKDDVDAYNSFDGYRNKIVR